MATQEVKNEQIKEMYSISSPYCNRVFLLVDQAGVAKVVCAEQDHLNNVYMRGAFSMTLANLTELASMINEVSARIKEQQEQQKKQESFMDGMKEENKAA